MNICSRSWSRIGGGISLGQRLGEISILIPRSGMLSPFITRVCSCFYAMMYAVGYKAVPGGYFHNLSHSEITVSGTHHGILLRLMPWQ